MSQKSFLQHGLRLPTAMVGVVLMVWSASGMAPSARAAEISAAEPSADERGLELFVGLRDILVHRCAVSASGEQ